jgi:hypothetical protein
VDAAEDEHATATVPQVQGGRFVVAVGMQPPPVALDALSDALDAAPHGPAVAIRSVQVLSGSDALAQLAPRQLVILLNPSWGALQATPVGLPHVHVHCADGLAGVPPSNTGPKPAPHVGGFDDPVQRTTGPVQPMGTGGAHVVPVGQPASSPASKIGASITTSTPVVVSCGASAAPVSEPPPFESAAASSPVVLSPVRSTVAVSALPSAWPPPSAPAGP